MCVQKVTRLKLDSSSCHHAWWRGWKALHGQDTGGLAGGRYGPGVGGWRKLFQRVSVSWFWSRTHRCQISWSVPEEENRTWDRRGDRQEKVKGLKARLWRERGGVQREAVQKLNGHMVYRGRTSSSQFIKFILPVLLLLVCFSSHDRTLA